MRKAEASLGSWMHCSRPIPSRVRLQKGSEKKNAERRKSEAKRCKECRRHSALKASTLKDPPESSHGKRGLALNRSCKLGSFSTSKEERTSQQSSLLALLALLAPRLCHEILCSWPTGSMQIASKTSEPLILGPRLLQLGARRGGLRQRQRTSRKHR